MSRARTTPTSMLPLRLHGLALAIAVSFAGFDPMPTWAQEPPEDGAEDLAEARQVFAEALELVEQERWADAEARFRLVLEARSSPVVSYNLASTLIHQGRVVEACELLRRVVRDEEADAETRDAAQQLLLQTEPRVGSLTVRVAGELDEGVALTIDGHTVELTGPVQAISVDPGSHDVVLSRAGKPVASSLVEVGGIASLHAEVRLALPERTKLRIAERAAALDAPPDPRVAPTPPDRDEGGGVLSSPWFWVGAGAVVAGGVVAAVMLAGGSQADPVAGDTDPPLLRGQVAGELP